MSLPCAAIELTVPVDCTLGQTCYIQQYKDNDPATGAVQDFACGAMANDGHSGTDFAVPSLRDVARGVPVVAAAQGIVAATRDGMDDIPVQSMEADLDGKDCGNGVRITHPDGWETQYCHLRKGSVSVQRGQSVDAGEAIGMVGVSGRASYPHIHFTLRHNGETVDPFDPDQSDDCTLTPPRDLWQMPLAYRGGGIIAAGFSDGVPKLSAIQQGLPIQKTAPSKTPALVVWGYLFNGLQGDVVTISLSGPLGDVGSHDTVLEKRQPFVMRAYGKRTPPQGWPKGQYQGSVRHARNGQTLEERRITIEIN